jgi:hypothetical protein
MIPNNYGVKKRKSRIIPFGYKLYPEDNAYLLPIPDELEAIKRAKKYIEEDHVPWRAVREWVVKATGRYVSITGLRQILGHEKKHVIRRHTATARKKTQLSRTKKNGDDSGTQTLTGVAESQTNSGT